MAIYLSIYLSLSLYLCIHIYIYDRSIYANAQLHVALKDADLASMYPGI